MRLIPPTARSPMSPRSLWRCSARRSVTLSWLGTRKRKSSRSRSILGRQGDLSMALAQPKICDFGWKAHDFKLKGVDGKTYTLADVRGPNGTLVTFICNHCPYVKAGIGRLVDEAEALRHIGIGTIAIMPN